jgi:diguanylate cyclase (GGDEF)-like protein
MADDVSAASSTLFRHNPEAAAVLRSGEAFVAIEDGTEEPDRPQKYAEVYLPVLGPRGPLGVAEAYVDMAAPWEMTETAFARFALLLTGLGFAALSIPTLHWMIAWKETRRKNAELNATARLEAQLASEVRLIGDLNEWLQSSRSQSELFEMVVKFLTRLLPACEGEIYVYANSRDVLDGCAGWAGRTPHDHIHPEDCWGLRRGRTYAYGEAEVGFPCAHAGNDDGRNYFCLPLLAHGETIGLLHLRQRSDADVDAFRESRRLAQLCAEQISMAIANVRMRDELQDQSIRDPLTGLFNRRHLTEMLRRYMSRAARQDTSVALLSIDVDHFKRFNDNFGHDAGDMVLRAVGEVIDGATDGDEVACRPGGEEFMVVLPESNVSEALHRAEAIRERIQAVAIRYGEKTLPSISASIGIALSPDDGTIPQDLMRAADEALYAAKAAGRNRAVLTTLIGIEADGPRSAEQDPKIAIAAAE